MYLNVWVPRSAYGGGAAGFCVGHRGHLYASTALMDPMAKAFVADIHGSVAARGLELVQFAKGQRKDDVTAQVLAKFDQEQGVLYVGRVQEKSGVWRTQRRAISPALGRASRTCCISSLGTHMLSNASSGLQRKPDDGRHVPGAPMIGLPGRRRSRRCHSFRRAGLLTNFCDRAVRVLAANAGRRRTTEVMER